jgi:hypothetical protein
LTTVAWNRPQSIEQIKRHIWRHLTQAASTDDEIVLDAAGLLNMRPADVRVFAQLHFIIADAVRDLLRQMPLLSRRLATTTEHELETSSERIQGAIRWGETIAARAATGLPHVFVTASARRAYDTPENQVLAFALRSIVDFGKTTKWHESTSAGLGESIRDRVAEAMKWQELRALKEVDSEPPQPKTIARVRSSRRRRQYRFALDVVDLYDRYIRRLDRAALRDAVEHRALVVSDNATLLELLCGFELIKALRCQGWSGRAARIFPQRLIYDAGRDGIRLRLYSQPETLPLSAGSIYGEVQTGHAISAGRLRPDYVIRLDRSTDTRWIIIEVKGVDRTVEESAREAIQNLLAYRRAFDPALSRQEEPYGLGIAWGADLHPAAEGEIRLCTPDQIPAAVETLLATSRLR